MQRQMHEKKKEYDILEQTSIFDIWRGDLDKFLEALDKYEEQEEKDRLAHTANAQGGNTGKRRNKHAAAKPSGKDKVSKNEAKPPKQGGGKQPTMQDWVMK